MTPHIIQLPASKSIAARFLVASYFAGTLPADHLFDDNDDLLVLQEALLEVYSDEEPIDYGDSQIDVGASGTALRFVTAVCASSQGADYIITGSQRLMQRPMTPLLDVLREAGAFIEAVGESGDGPFRVKGVRLNGGNFSIPGNISSQFISALMLVAPSWEKGMTLSFTTPPVSLPYIEMTARVMEKFGIKPKLSDMGVEVPHGKYVDSGKFIVEADWSSAAFFYEAAALGVDNIELENLSAPEFSIQGDAVAARLFHGIGVNSEFKKEGAVLSCSDVKSSKVEVDFKDCPDLVLPYAVACLCSGVHFKFSNMAHLRVKESDRIASLQSEALKLGYIINATTDTIEWDGRTQEPLNNPTIETHNDHRVAMSFAMAALKFGEIRISNPEVVEKSFINFWNQLPQIGLSCRQEGDIMIVTK